MLGMTLCFASAFLCPTVQGVIIYIILYIYKMYINTHHVCYFCNCLLFCPRLARTCIVQTLFGSSSTFRVRSEEFWFNCGGLGQSEGRALTDKALPLRESFGGQV